MSSYTLYQPGSASWTFNEPVYRTHELAYCGQLTPVFSLLVRTLEVVHYCSCQNVFAMSHPFIFPDDPSF